MAEEGAIREQLLDEGYPVASMTDREMSKAWGGELSVEEAKNEVALREKIKEVKYTDKDILANSCVAPGGNGLTDKDGGSPTITGGEVIATLPPGTLITQEMIDAIEKGFGKLNFKGLTPIEIINLYNNTQGRGFKKTQGGSRKVPAEEWKPEAIEKNKKQMEDDDAVIRTAVEHHDMKAKLRALDALQTLEDDSEDRDAHYPARIVRRYILLK